MKSLRRLAHAITGLTIAISITGTTLLAAPTAQALPGARDATTVTADPLPTTQVNGVVWKQQIAGKTVFAGGEFTTARPAGASPGTQEVPRNNLLAYNLETGELDQSFAPNVNGKVKAMALSPDGKTLYIGGSFNKINGQDRYRGAAFNVASGELLPWNPAFNATVSALVATRSAIYAGGGFNRIGSVQRMSLAAVSPTGAGALLAWAPTTNAQVQALAITKDESRIVVAGNFSNINGLSARGLGAVSTANGSALPFPTNSIIQNSGDRAAFLSLQMDSDDNVYGAGYANGSTGQFFEGLFSSKAMTGELNWLADCHGDTYDANPMNGAVYAVSHHHHCENIDGFPDPQPTRFWQRADAFTVEATGTVRTNNQRNYPNFGGNPSPSFVPWFPDVASGTYTGQSQGPWTVTSNDEYLLLGGEFPTVNNVRQQGLARFAIRSKATNKVGPEGTPESLTPKVFQTSPTSVRMYIPATWDRDDLKLTYQVFREGVTDPVATVTNEAVFWNTPAVNAGDSGLTPGNTYRYRVRVSDSTNNTITSPWVSITMNANVAAYPAAVLSDGASHYWQLGTNAPLIDIAGNMPMDTVGATVDNNGAYQGSSASSFNGLTGTAGSTTHAMEPMEFSVEAWFKTTTLLGGKIVGFGNTATAKSTQYDRQIYMSNNGRLVFGTYDGSTTHTIQTPTSYNNGQWHHVVGTLSPAGLSMYVNGVKIGTVPNAATESYYGTWRIGGDNVDGWPNAPLTRFFRGSIDDVAVYPAALTTTQVRNHYTASGRTLNIPAPPTDSYGKAVYAEDPSFQWRLNETSGTTASDTSGNNGHGSTSGGVSWGASSPVAPGTGVTLNGTNAVISTRTAVASPNTYSSEVWFNTTTTAGGKILGFGNRATGNSGNYDRHIYMSPNGRVSFGVWSGKQHVITSQKAYNDGEWHQAVATLGHDGMKLYIDGVLAGSNPQTRGDVYNGHWRVGGDSTWDGAAYFRGQVDEVSVYDKVLTAEQVRAHYQASPASGNSAPTARIGTPSCTSLKCSFSGSGTDPDGTIASYAWDFGDGSTATGATATHTYAAPGTYTVTLTVTDDQGATGSSRVDVTASAPPANQDPTASFTVDQTDLKVTVDGSASSDPDGSIAGYKWDFGDGSTATGATATHTYASAGTYTVTLTVTDNAGADAVKKQDITVKGIVVSDDFDRAAANSWGNADTGGAWTYTSPARFSTADGAGVITLPTAATNGTAYLNGVSVQDLDLTATIATPSMPTGSGVQTTMIVRRVNASTDYRVTYQMHSDGYLRLNVTRRVNGTSTSLGDVKLTSFTYTAGDRINLRLMVTGDDSTSIAVKAWKDGTPEPANPSMTRTDATAELRAPGSFAISSYLAANANQPAQVKLDNLRMKQI